MRILGLDVGDKTIGIAVSDPLMFTAQGITTIKRINIGKDIEALKKICEEYSVDEFLVGLPKNMNGTLGPQSEKVMEFCKVLEKKFKKKITLWDERLTTVAAEKAMLEADLSRKKRKKIIDKIAATYILQGYLDSLTR
ncbi:MAG: Holliday junction resolvase RuvX [Bacillota bacterium]|nr:Holliday junction resolvase RuvX [Bacillota bacterium]